MLGIEWDPKTDLYTPNSEWNVSAKSCGTYKDKSLKLMSDSELQNIEVTKTLISRILGQTHKPLEKNYSSLLVCIKILLRKASQLTNRWKEVIDDLQLKQNLIKLIKHIRDTTVLPQLRAVVPGGYTIVKLNVSGDGSQMAAAYTWHLLSVHMANQNKKNSTLGLAS